ncbi:SBBP repeat-containing protein [Lacipirellula parvula]|uniref:Beta-propeller repeat protein n=1 Tax=Lacipirellula parvula TaxID=2650471 RepID=A0A5K7XEC4_9BACT|nr:SBBP repeat-containing protein [Lacipirellula parvula]BBO33221.1 hypothetical protein PLANPX_2833 [Lacipirellula parvula]
MSNFWRKAAIVAVLIRFLAATPVSASPVLEWSRQFGTAGEDRAYAIATDLLGNAYITGDTRGSLAAPLSGISDAFLSKFDASGNRVWTAQLGSTGGERSYGVATDGVGSVYISGATGGSLNGPQAGFGDAILSRYTTDGVLLWSRQLGTASADVSNAVAVDGIGNVFISGYTEDTFNGPHVGLQDAFLAKYDVAGNRIWTRQLGTKQLDSSLGLAVDGLGNVYTTGFTGGDLVNGTNHVELDAFLAKYDADGNRLWIKQLGQLVDTTTAIRSNGVTYDNLGNVYLTGFVGGEFAGPSAGVDSAFLCKFDANGNLLWKAQLAAGEGAQGQGVATDGQGNVYISGAASGDLQGPSAGLSDMFLSKFDQAGNRLWTMQLGSAETDFASGVSADFQGNVYITGFTSGSLGGANAGDDDIVIAKIRDTVPEPSACSLSVAAIVALISRSRRSSVRKRDDVLR